VAVVFRHQPLPFHNNAKPAALASMAAHKQGKFWEYHDKLFANQQALDAAGLEKAAEELKLNMAKFKKDMADPEVAKLVEKDMADGNAVGANGTPTFFINGRELSGAQPFPAFESIINEEIKKADDLIKGGTKIEEVYTKLMEQAANAPKPAPAAAPAEPTQVTIAEADIKGRPLKGSPKAPVTILEFSDFQ